jgi:hypothetical protein
MFNTATCLYTIVLFVLLTPGILLRLPPKGSPLVVAIVHGAVFALVLCFTHKIVYRMSNRYSIDGFAACTEADKMSGKQDVSGNCV